MSGPDAAVRAAMRALALSARGALAQAGLSRHRRRNRGASRTFREHRAYVPGDDVRQIDWRALARTGRPTIKTFEDEAQMHLLVGLEISPSMHFGAGAARKLTAASTLAHALCAMAVAQDDAAGLWTLGPGGRLLAPKPGATQIARLLYALASPPPRDGSSAWPVATPAFRWPLRRRRPHRVVLIGDWLGAWLAPRDDGPAASTPLGRMLSALSSAKHAVSLMHIVHPTEQDFPFHGARQFRADECGAPVLTDATRAKPRYMAALAQHAATLRNTCAKAGVGLHTQRTDTSLVAVLQALAARTEARQRVNGL